MCQHAERAATGEHFQGRKMYLDIIFTRKTISGTIIHQ